MTKRDQALLEYYTGCALTGLAAQFVKLLQTNEGATEAITSAGELARRLATATLMATRLEEKDT